MQGDIPPYLGEESANPSAKTRIPIADIVVKVLRAAGLARNTEALSTPRISVLYQERETVACTPERMIIPHPNEKCFGTN